MFDITFLIRIMKIRHNIADVKKIYKTYNNEIDRETHKLTLVI